MSCASGPFARRFGHTLMVLNTYRVTLSDGSKHKIKATTAIAAKNKVVKSIGKGLYAVTVIKLNKKR